MEFWVGKQVQVGYTRASPQIPATAYFGVSFMHTGGVLGVYNARVLLEGANDGD